MYNAPYPARLAVSPMEQMEFNQLSVSHLANIFMRHRLLILAIVFAITGATALSQMLVDPQYVARSTTKIEFFPSEDARGVVPVAEKEMRMETQTKLMGSRSLAEMVVRELQLHNNPQFTGRPAINTSTLSPKRVQERISVTTRKLQSVTEVKRQPRTQLIEVAVATSDAELSARIADEFSQALQHWDDRARANDREKQINFLDRKVGNLATRLAQSEQAIADFRKTNQMPVGAGTTADLSQIGNLTAEAANASANRAATRARASGIASAGLGAAAYDDNSPTAAQIQRQIAELGQRKAELSVTFGPGYPEMQAVDAQLRAAQAALASETKRAHEAAVTAASAAAAREAKLASSEAAGAAARSAVLTGAVSQLTAQAYRNVQGNVTLDRLERSAALMRDLYADARRSLAEATASRGNSSMSATVLAPAAIPTAPINVTPKKDISAALFGSALLGFLVAFAWEMLDTRLRSANDIRRRFALPTFAMLPAVDPKLLANPANNPVLRQPRSLFAEVARSLYLEVAGKPKPDGARIITITSPLPGDGKSTVALSLAAAAMKHGARAILIDLDLRRDSVLQDIQRASGDPDLIDYVSNRHAIQNLLPHIVDPVRQASIDLQPDADDTRLPAILSTYDRIADPGALISSPALREMLQRLRGQFDLIVVNAPPILAVRDARTLSGIADDTLMVVNWGSTKTEELATAIDAMGDAPLGVVFNNVDYADHARRRHSDSLQYFAKASCYYDEDGSGRSPSRRLSSLPDWRKTPAWRWLGSIVRRGPDTAGHG